MISDASFFTRNFAFLRYQAARFLAIIGWQVQSAAVGWLLYVRMHDPVALALAGLVQFLPMIVFAPLGGWVADRFARPRILVVCHLLLIAVAGMFAYLTTRPEWGAGPMYFGLFLLGTIRAFTGPASQAIVPTLVSKTDFPRAIAISSVILNLATLAGPSLGGAALDALERLHAAGYLFIACAALFSLMPVTMVSLPKTTQAFSGDSPSLGTMIAGLGFVLRNRPLLGALSLDLFAVLFGGAVALLPIFAHDVLHAGAREFGYLRSASAVGAFAVALILTVVPLRRHAGLWMFGSVLVFGLATILFALSTSLWLSLVALLVVGAADMLSVQVRHTLVQLYTPDEMRGRVSAINMIFITTSNEFGEFESGLTAKWMGTIPATLFGGALSCVVVFVWFALFPELRRFQGSEQDSSS